MSTQSNDLYYIYVFSLTDILTLRNGGFLSRAAVLPHSPCRHSRLLCKKRNYEVPTNRTAGVTLSNQPDKLKCIFNLKDAIVNKDIRNIFVESTDDCAIIQNACQPPEFNVTFMSKI